MAILAKHSPTQQFQDTIIYTVPEGVAAVLSLNICNTEQTEILASVALLEPGKTEVTEADYIERHVAILPTGVMERTGIALSEGESLAVSASKIGLNFIAIGMED